MVERDEHARDFRRSAADGLDEREAKRLIKVHSPRRAARRRERLGRPIMALAMTPMIDVTFLLLVFFLLVTDFSGREEALRVDLPAGAVAATTPAGGAPDDAFALDRPPVRVLVTSTGPGPDDCRLEVVGLGESPRSLDELHHALRRERVDPAARGGMYLADHPVVIEPSPATSWEHSVAAFNAAVRAGYVNVIFRGV